MGVFLFSRSRRTRNGMKLYSRTRRARQQNFAAFMEWKRSTMVQLGFRSWSARRPARLSLRIDSYEVRLHHKGVVRAKHRHDEVQGPAVILEKGWRHERSVELRVFTGASHHMRSTPRPPGEVGLAQLD